MPDLSRILQFLGRWRAPLDDMIAEGDRALTRALAEGDRRAAEVPELAPEWQVARQKLIDEWNAVRVTLVDARDNPEVAARIQAGVVEALATVLHQHGEVGKPHGHAG